MHVIDKNYPDGWGYGNEVYCEKHKEFGVVENYCHRDGEKLIYTKFYSKDNGELRPEVFGPFKTNELENISTK